MTTLNKQEAQQRLDTLRSEIDKLEKIINTPEKTPAERFWELVSGTELKVDFETYPNRIFGFRGDKYVWEFDFGNNYLWLRYSTVWSVLETEYSLDYNDVQALVRSEVEEHFKCRGVTPVRRHPYHPGEVEEHFKCRGVTARAGMSETGTAVEEHFK